MMRKTKRNWTAAVCVLTAALSTTPVFAAKEKEESTSKANTESISKEASAKDDGERTIIDHAGNEVTLPEEINRIVVTDTLPLPSVLSLYLDSAEKLVGISPVSMSAAKAGLLGELYPEILDADTSFFENNELPLGTITVWEMHAPEGYLVDTVTHCIRTGTEQNGSNKALKIWNPVEIKEKIIRGDLKLVKAEDKTLKRLSDIPFQITSKATGESHTGIHILSTRMRGRQVKTGSGLGKELRIIQEERFLMERIWWKNCLVKIMKTGC